MPIDDNGNYRPWEPGDTCRAQADGKVHTWVVARPNSIPIGDWVAGRIKRTIEVIRFNQGEVTWVRDDSELFNSLMKEFNEKEEVT